MANLETFRISAALKDIIGKELITDEFVAVFELVKNSFDANATKVEVIFENNYETETARIIIKDNGIGMNYDDLKNKWLFVAYSAKKLGRENEDYRDKIKTKRVFAGAKGVGRFSCDRLGKYLNLITIKDEPNSKIENLVVNWEDFENADDEEFVNIKVTHNVLIENIYNIKTGTILEITGLRDNWDRKKILRLKDSLGKLINPNQENDINNFEIHLICGTEVENDKNEKDNRKKINGEVKNFVFEKLNYKTTQIVCSIDKSGESITTTLTDRGQRIYSLNEQNIYFTKNVVYPKYLSDIKIFLFQLNRAAKANFTRDMGIDAVKYGSVFLYKNGFRIYPFGESGDDSLKIDKRKQQGHSRNLGTRDLLGRIEINGSNEFLKETSSRAEGLIKNEHYDLLLEFFEEKALRRLEDYVVNIIEWGDDRVFELDEKINLPNLTPDDVRKEITSYIKKLANAKNVISIDYDKNFIDILNENIDQSINKSLRQLAKKAKNRNDEVSFKEAVKLKNEWNRVLSDTYKAEKHAKVEIEKRKEIEKKLDFVVSQKNFLQSEISDDTKNLESILHHIGLTTNFIKKDIENLVKAINSNVSKYDLFKIIKRLSLQNEKITSFSKYFKKVNFNIHSNKLDVNIISFTNEYIENVYNLREDLRKNRELLNVKINMPIEFEHKMKFNPIDMIIVLDNLISNSSKHGASTVELTWTKSGHSIQLSFKDDGNGISDNILENIFDFGFTTSRRGSGIGLYHIKEIIENLNGTVEVNNKLIKGVEFIFTFKGI